MYLAPCLQWHKKEYGSLHAVLASRDACVAHTVAALIGVERGAAGFPSGIPDGVAVFQVEVASVVVHWHVVVAVTCNAAELGVFVEAVASGGV